MKLTAILPTYRPGLYIEKCLESIFSQTLNSQLFEVIIVLNGEKYPYYHQIAEIIKYHPNVRIIYTDLLGVSNARNIGIKEAKSKNITFIDDDDFISENYFLYLLNVKEAYPLTSIIVSNFKVYCNGIITDDYLSIAYDKLKNSKYSLVKYRKFLSGVPGKLIDRGIIEDIEFNTKLKIGEDSVFMFEISKNIKDVKFAPIDCIYYRNLRENSAIRKKKNLLLHTQELALKVYYFSKVLFNSSGYDYYLYATRILASFKMYFIQIYKNIKK